MQLKYDIEDLKKEVWFLKNSVIPDIENQISGLGGEDVEEIKLEIVNITNSLNSIQNYLDTLNGKVSTNESNISEVENKISSIQQTLTSINSEISSLKEDGNIYASQIDSVSACYDRLNDSLSSTQTDVTQISNSLSQTSSSLTSLTQSVDEKITALENKITQLESKVGSSSGEDTTLLFYAFSDDSNINLGYTSGIQGGTTLNIDLTPYRALRIYALVGNYDCQKVIMLNNRKKNDITLHTSSPSLNLFNYQKITVPVTTPNQITFGSWCRFEWSKSTSSVTYTSGTFSSSTYCYRLEGIK